MNRYRISGTLLVAAALLLTNGSPLFAHCEIPCGIYGDQTRIVLLKEHISTIEKSMKQIVELSGESPVQYNQLVRWISNKEEHAEKLQHIVTQYFMTQRLKLPEDGAELDAYTKKLACLHRMLLSAMKCKQTTELAHVESLKFLVDEFSALYFNEDKKEHLEKHHQ